MKRRNSQSNRSIVDLDDDDDGSFAAIDDDDDDGFIVDDDDDDDEEESSEDTIESDNDDDDDDGSESAVGDVAKMLHINLNSEERRLQKKRAREMAAHYGDEDDDDDDGSEAAVDDDDESATLDGEEGEEELQDDIRETIRSAMQVGNVNRFIETLGKRAIERVQLFGNAAQWRSIMDAAAASLQWYAEPVNKVPRSVTRCFVCQSTKALSMRMMNRDDELVGYCGRNCGEAFNLLTQCYKLRANVFGSMAAINTSLSSSSAAAASNGESRNTLLEEFTSEFKRLVDDIDAYVADASNGANRRKPRRNLRSRR